MKLRTAIFAAILATTGVTATTAFADYDDHIEHQVYQDANFQAVQQRAINTLKRQGYQVTDIDVDTHMGKPILEIEAYKGGQEYDIKMSYPDLRIISQTPD